jgi:hypothetical protein
LRQIADDAFGYCLYERGEALPDGQGGEVTYDRIPEPLHWKRWTERYGFPREGTWRNQPINFMWDIEAARRGEDSAKK